MNSKMSTKIVNLRHAENIIENILIFRRSISAKFGKDFLRINPGAIPRQNLSVIFQICLQASIEVLKKSKASSAKKKQVRNIRASF